MIFEIKFLKNFSKFYFIALNNLTSPPIFTCCTHPFFWNFNFYPNPIYLSGGIQMVLFHPHCRWFMSLCIDWIFVKTRSIAFYCNIFVYYLVYSYKKSYYYFAWFIMQEATLVNYVTLNREFSKFISSHRQINVFRWSTPREFTTSRDILYVSELTKFIWSYNNFEEKTTISLKIAHFLDTRILSQYCK